MSLGAEVARLDTLSERRRCLLFKLVGFVISHVAKYLSFTIRR